MIKNKRNLNYLKKQLRQLFVKSETREQVFRDARIRLDGKIRFQCSICTMCYRKSSMEVDHKVKLAFLVEQKVGKRPTVSKYLSIFVKELFNEKNLQLLCKSCHAHKTWEEK